MIGVNERTIGHIVKPDGSLATVPTTLIGADTAAIMRAYFTWAMTNQLEPELFCGDCYDHSRNSKAQFDISDQQVVITCACQLRLFQGASLPPSPVTPSMTAPSDDAGVGRIALSDAAARLLRTYKKVLLALNLKEALRCSACYALNQSDGCEAQVLPGSIRIMCCCSNRTFTGQTI